MKLLLDTCVLVDVLHNKVEAIAYMRASGDQAAICPITVMELYAGARSQRDEKVVDALIGTFDIVGVEIGSYRRAGEYLQHFQASHALDVSDALIAATAEQHGLKLATLNVKHFPMFPKLKPPY